MRITFAAMSAIFMALYGQAGAATPTLNHVLQALPAPGTVKVDGDLQDWDLSGAISVTDSVEEPRRLASVAAMYDAAGLYLTVRFKDRTPMVNRVNPVTARGRAWYGDCVQLRINIGPRPNQESPKPLQILHIDAYWFSEGGKATAYIVYGNLVPGGKVAKTIEEAEGNGILSGYRKDADSQGYVQELRLDWKLLRPDDGVPFKPGESLHMAVELMWNDAQYKDQPAMRVTDLLNPKRPERDMIWANPQAFGTVEFVAKGNVKASATGKLWPELVQKNAALADSAPDPAAIAVPEAVDRPCLEERNDIERRLNTGYAAKTAAGNVGDIYDNRDREHSAIERKAFPQLRSVEYTPGQKLESWDYALFLGVRPQVTFGNSSTSAEPERGGCNVRFAMMAPIGLLQLYAQYRGSNLYVYPAHHDYHPGRSGHGFYGDLLPVNQPYSLLSRGSSGSDIPFLNAVIHASAAFAPEVKGVLVRHGLLMPTIQALMRSTYGVGQTPEDYFTGNTHPAVFEGALLDEAKLVSAVHALTPQTIPPLAQVQAAVTEVLLPGVNAPATFKGERLCDSPCAVGFVFRRWDRTLKLVASASASVDWQDKSLTYRWELLQGDPGRVRIEPFDGGRQARIAVGWHDRFPVQAGSLIHTNRVDIGLFVNNGQAWSAPAFISVVCPDNELRTYDERDRLVDVQYAAMDTAIGFETSCVFPAEGVPPYDIRNWPELLHRVAQEGDLFGRLCAESLTRTEQVALAAAASELAALTAAQEKEQKANEVSMSLNNRWIALRRNAEGLSKVVLASVPALGGSLKDRMERMLNAWQDDPLWYLNNFAAFDEAWGQVPKESRELVMQARERLLETGIYRAEGGTFVLQARRRGDGPQDLPEELRLTAAERLELRRFHLLLQTQVLLPGILVRDAQFNYVDHRLLQAQPQWLALDYDGETTLPRRVVLRAVATPPQAKELENP